jgi:hypothetical protein
MFLLLLVILGDSESEQFGLSGRLLNIGVPGLDVDELRLLQTLLLN